METSLATSNAMCIALVGPVFPGNSPLSLLGERLIAKAPSCRVHVEKEKDANKKREFVPALGEGGGELRCHVLGSRQDHRGLRLFIRPNE